MTWDDTPLGSSFGNDALDRGRQEAVELVGTHLRLNGNISLGRFGRLTDLINASSGYVRVHQAQLLRRNGDPTNLILSELMVDQDEISYIAQPETISATPGTRSNYDDHGVGGAIAARQTREFVLFTPGHTVSGTVYIFGETDLAGFVDSSHPRFVPMIDVTTRSLADRRIISHYPFILINRTQMIAASEIGQHGNIDSAEAAPDFPDR